MQLSIVIVNYNVEYFLEQCLQSVFKAIKGIDAEVFVVDNNSVDGSVKMVKEKFPQTILFENKENAGFSKANNQAIEKAIGKYILLLNPDTVVEEDTFTKVLDFMESHPDAGGLGVKMVDGKGKFLPESKRGLPTPAAAFYKIFGLSKLFPKSKVFGKYHLGYLDNNKTHSVDVLSGAFMLMRKEALSKSGLLDETFFMYGEDIDLSYRITQSGYKNYYFPETRIIHYKGESTKKSSVNYVLVFYNAMVIFAKKHFSKQNARLFSLLINLAIYFRALLAIIQRFLNKILKPLLDVVLLYGGISLITEYWQTFKFEGSEIYPIEFFKFALPGYIILWLISIFLTGGYDKPLKISRVFQGVVFGTISILVIYSLLPESLRYSRAIILMGSLWALVTLTGYRGILGAIGVKSFQSGDGKNKRFLIIGEKEEAKRVSEILRNSALNPGFTGLVSINKESNGDFIGNLNQVKDIIDIYKINELIFCTKNIPAQLVIDKMTELQSMDLEFKTAPEEGSFLIGSNSINTQGDIYMNEINSISKAPNRRNKRIFDMAASLIGIIGFPVFLFFVKRPIGFLINSFKVLFGIQSWVGYQPQKNKTNINLPRIKKGVLYPTDSLKKKDLSEDTVQKLNILYAKDYKVLNDFNTLIRGIKQAGRKCSTFLFLIIALLNGVI